MSTTWQHAQFAMHIENKSLLQRETNNFTRIQVNEARNKR